MKNSKYLGLLLRNAHGYRCFTNLMLRLKNKAIPLKLLEDVDRWELWRMMVDLRGPPFQPKNNFIWWSLLSWTSVRIEGYMCSTFPTHTSPMASIYKGCPEDLAREILLRLPVKSLLRFKCGCKNWYALINNPAFIKQHLNCSNKNNTQAKLLIYDYGAQDNSPPITLINSDGSGPLHENLDYFQRFRGMKDLVGSVDGLFLLERVTDGDANISLALWNPAIREVRPLPAAQFDCEMAFPRKYFGFGLDPLTSDYKVVCFTFVFNYEIPDSGACSVYAAVYSCSRDSWKFFSPDNVKISNYYSCCRAASTAYRNGAYYWKIQGNKCIILSFDFGNEVFGEIEGPDCAYFADLILLDDSIAFLNTVDDAFFDIWVMIQPGVWNKLLSFQCFTYFLSWYSSTAILVTQRSRLVSYNVRTKETKHLGYRHEGLRIVHDGCSVYYYKESLVTIKRGYEELDRCSILETYDSSIEL